MGFSEILLREGLNLPKNQLKQYYDILYKQSRTIYGLLDNLLEWARSQTGMIEFRPKPLQINDLVHTVRNQVSYLAESKHIHLLTDRLESCPLNADRHMLLVILRNLLTNAIKYSHPGSCVEISSVVSGDYVLISIRDEGVGMKAETLSGLFETKTIESRLGTENEQGTGLGLMICHDFVMRHKGKLTAESSPGQGSIFTVSLPL